MGTLMWGKTPRSSIVSFIYKKDIDPQLKNFLDNFILNFTLYCQKRDIKAVSIVEEGRSITNLKEKLSKEQQGLLTIHSQMRLSDTYLLYEGIQSVAGYIFESYPLDNEEEARNIIDKSMLVVCPIFSLEDDYQLFSFCGKAYMSLLNGTIDIHNKEIDIQDEVSDYKLLHNYRGYLVTTDLLKGQNQFFEIASKFNKINKSLTEHLFPKQIIIPDEFFNGVLKQSDLCLKEFMDIGGIKGCFEDLYTKIEVTSNNINKWNADYDKDNRAD